MSLKNKIDFGAFGLSPSGATPNERQIEWFDRERMVFFHFGMNTFTDKEWGDGTESPSTFNPTELDVRQWVKAIKDGGFTAAILTAKHHDGFCLWPSAYTEHSIKNSPYKDGKGDIVREFTDACAELGIKAGIYLSPWDRHEKTWGKDEYNDFYVGQLTELLTNYGKIWECWWDGAGSTEAVYDWERWARTVRTLQPDAVIFGSLGATPFVDVRWVGNEKGVAGKPCYATIDEISLVVETTSELNSGKLGGERFIPAEVDVSIRPGWFYHKEQDCMVRTPENLIDLWFNSNGSNAGFLLNLPPDRRGLIHENDVKSLLDFKKTLDKCLSVNYADGATIECDNERAGCEAENLISDTPSRFYSSNDDNEESIINITLKEKSEFNTVIIREIIELGHKVTDICADVLANGEWKEVFKSKCIGYRLAERFDTVLADKIRLRIKGLKESCALYGLGVHNFTLRYEKNSTKSDKNLALSQGCAVEITDNCIDVNLGGVIHFNKIKVENPPLGKCELLVFNGFSFEKYASAETKDSCLNLELDKAVDYAHRFKLVFENPLDKEKAKLSVFHM